MGSVWRCLKHVRWVAGSRLAGLTAHALLAPAILALVILAALVVVLAVLMLRWIISSDDRSARVIRMILALRGGGGSLTKGHSALSSPENVAKPWWRELRRSRLPARCSYRCERQQEPTGGCPAVHPCRVERLPHGCADRCTRPMIKPAATRPRRRRAS
jgi:hypothetical protein